MHISGTAKRFLPVLLSMVICFSCLSPIVSFAEDGACTVLVDGGQTADSSFCFLGDRFYYNGTDGVTSCRLDGTDLHLVSPESGTLFTDGESLYCGSKSKIVRLGDDDEDEVLLRVYPLVNEGAFSIMNTMGHFAARDDSIYYVLTMAQDYELWKIHADGSGNQRLCSLCPPDCCILDVFFSDSLDGIFVRYCEDDAADWTLLRITE